MKLNSMLGSALAVLLLAGCVSDDQKQAKLRSEAKLSQADAEKIALGKVPNGTIKEAELEKENGVLLWSFDITTPNSKELTEVEVNAITGEIVASDSEKDEDGDEKEDDSKTERD